jgi:hypothetical protein
MLFAGRTEVGGNYTLSSLGQFRGENAGSGPIVADVFQYPEYRQLSSTRRRPRGISGTDRASGSITAY